MPRGKRAEPLPAIREVLESFVTDEGVIFKVVQKGGVKDGEVYDSQAFPLAEIPAKLKARSREVSVAAYGLGVLLRDRTSDAKDPRAKIAAMREQWALFRKGLWREYAEGRILFSPLLPDAIIRAYGYPPGARGKVVERLRGKTAEEIAALEKEHADLIAQLEAERGEAGDIDF